MRSLRPASLISALLLLTGLQQHPTLGEAL